MRVRKAIKKIAALAAGATMLGATMMGAMAADLANYPAPFVDGCSFSGAVVIGAAASAEDVVGAVDVTSTLAVSGTTTTSGATSAVTVTGEAMKIETNTNKLNMGDNLTDVQTTAMDDSDLPTVLADGTFTSDDSVEYDYEQTIDFEGDDANSYTQFTHFADSDYMDKEPTLGLYSAEDKNFTIYKLDFTKNIVSDLSAGEISDVEDTTINILGNTYDITDASNTSTKITLTLMGGALKDVLEQGQTKTYTLDDKDYEVEIVYIGTSGGVSKVKFKINGEVTDAIAEDGTKKLKDGTTVGVREILEEEAGEVTADQVEFYLGAEKLKFEDTAAMVAGGTAGAVNGVSKVEMNDEDIDDLYVDILANGNSDDIEIDYILLTWKPEEEIFVTEEQDAILPGLESFKVTYEGFSVATEEEIEIKDAGNNEVELTIPIASGKATIPLIAGNGTHFTAIGGEDSDEILRTVNGAAASMAFDRDTDESFVATYLTGADCESYQLKVSTIDSTDGATFRDVVSGTDVATNKKNASSFTVGDVAITVNWFENANKTVHITGGANVYFDRICSDEGLLVYLPYNSTATTLAPAINLSNPVTLPAYPTTYEIKIEEEDENGNIGAGKDLNVTVGWASAKVGVSTLARVATELTGYKGGNGNVYEIGDTDEFVGYAKGDLGSKVLWDKDPDQDTVKIIYHGEEAFGNAYIAESEAGFGSGTVSGEAVCKVDVPPAKLDSEISDPTAQNLIIVGGPCANSVASAVSGIPQTEPECYEQYTEGKAKIKMYEQTTGKVAMLVAGFAALDTRRATRVLKNYEDYDLSGDEVEVSGTSLTDISVAAPSAE